MISKSEKCTLVLDPDMHDKLRRMAVADGKRSLTSLLRKIVAKSLAEWEQHEEHAA